MEQPQGALDLIDEEAFVIVKAAPRHSDTFGETVCCAGLDREGRWVRLYPIAFRHLDDAQKFGRWDHIQYRWSRPKASKDQRTESRRVDHNSIVIKGKLKQADRNPLVARAAVSSLVAEAGAGRSLALLKPEILEFKATRRSAEQISDKASLLSRLRAQDDFFAPKAFVPSSVCPYEFRYRYRDDDGEHEGTCQDWETEQTFMARLRDQASEKAAVDWMMQKFGSEYPQKGMALAMGTHRYRLHQWLINGVVRLNDDPQLPLI